MSRHSGPGPDWRAVLRRGMWPEGLVAALASLSIAWPITDLLLESTWVLPAVVLVGVVALMGAVLRTLDAPPTLVALGQLLAGVVGVMLVHLRDTLTLGVVPTVDTVRRAGELLGEAGTTLQTYAAPAPTTAGVAFLVVAVLVLTSVSVDSMGVTGRSPASAGIPLLAGFMVSVSNTGRAMEAKYFVAVTVLWLIMLLQQHGRLVRAWPSANRKSTWGGLAPRRGSGPAYVGAALVVAGAVLGATMLPHQPPTFFGGGLARTDEGTEVDSQAGEVAFTETMDVTQDLMNESQVPVLRYETERRGPEPLRVTASETYVDGRWEAPERTGAELSPFGARIGHPAGLREDIPARSYETRVLDNQLQPPHLAVPAPVIQLQLDTGATYRWSDADGTVVLQGESPRYAVASLQVDPAGLPEDVGATPADPALFPEELLALDPVSEEGIRAMAAEIVGDETNDLYKATLIQDHFRNSGLYTYSLELAAEAREDASDPIGGFLRTRQGYCMQFATSMVMMARAEGIPARMAVGFLPGETQPDGSRAVVAADAHTWPELWISGLGWTRFEPTPGARAASVPPWTPTETLPEEATATARPTDTEASTEDAPATSSPTPTPAPDADTDGGTGPTDGPDLLPFLLLLLPVVALMVLVPWLGRRHREAALKAARTPVERVEGLWVLLTRSLRDLGVAAPPARSPREMGDHYASATVLDEAGGEALTRVAATLQTARYADPARLDEATVESMEQDVDTVLSGARESADRGDRLRARFWPRSAWDGLRGR